MKTAEEYKKELLPLLPENAFLKKDRGEALFVSDAPRRQKNFALNSNAFDTAEKGGLLYITPRFAQYPADLRPLLLLCVKNGIGSEQKEIRNELALRLRKRSTDAVGFLKSMIRKTEDME